ncbi:hypothetical protein [Neobacillus sp. LXY-1]|uniref:hypothetical protein n=1 Tax=Neobacillus sp. LXY-1 TaxID=3379133 RepID=UPI003EDECB9B
MSSSSALAASVLRSPPYDKSTSNHLLLLRQSIIDEVAVQLVAKPQDDLAGSNLALRVSFISVGETPQ